MNANDWLFTAGMLCLIVSALTAFAVWCVNLLTRGDAPNWRTNKQRAIRNTIHKLAYDDLTYDEWDDLTWHLHGLLYEYRTG